MIDFSTQQLSWIVVGALGIGGTGYMTMNQKIDDLSEKVSVSNANMDNNIKSFERLQKQIDRIENKIDNQKR
jgi:uncharacterized protein HemX